MSGKQFSFDFTPGISQEWRTLKAITVAVVQNSGSKQSTIATACDLSPSELSKSLSGAEGRRFDVNWLEAVLDTGDLRPLYYLMEKYLESPEAKRDRAIAELAEFVKRAPELLKQAGVKK